MSRDVVLQWLLEPITPQAFFAEYYERQPLLIARGEPRRFEPLLSLSAIDRFACHHLAVSSGGVLGGCGTQAQRRGLYACRPGRGRAARPAAPPMSFSAPAPPSRCGACMKPARTWRACAGRSKRCSARIFRAISTYRRPRRRASPRTSTATTCSCCKWPDRRCGRFTTR